MNTKKVTITEFILNAAFVFAVFSVLQGLSVFEHINKIWMALTAGLLVLRFWFYRYTPNEFIMLMITVVIHLVALYFTEFPLFHVNMLFYLLLWVLMYLFAAKSRHQILGILRQSDLFICGVLTAWTGIVGISIFLPSSYEGIYFYSFTDSSFRLMPTVLIIQALAMYMSVTRHNRRYELFLIVPTYAAFMNSSRTYFAVYVLFLFLYVYMRCKNRRTFYFIMIPLVVVMVLLMAVSGIADKIIERLTAKSSFFDYWGVLTSGRTYFWRWDLEAFFALPVWQQFVGNGYNFAYDVTAQHFSTGIWAHNDIINLLMNFGYIGVAVYLWAYVRLVKAYMPKSSRIPGMVRFLFHGAVWFNSMFNMSYTYLCAMISYPIFLFVISERYAPIRHSADHSLQEQSNG